VSYNTRHSQRRSADPARGKARRGSGTVGFTGAADEAPATNGERRRSQELMSVQCVRANDGATQPNPLLYIAARSNRSSRRQGFYQPTERVARRRRDVWEREERCRRLLLLGWLDGPPDTMLCCSGGKDGRCFGPTWLLVRVRMACEGANGLGNRRDGIVPDRELAAGT
jgi:hypothetical protein